MNDLFYLFLTANIYPIKLSQKDHTHTLDAVTLRTAGFGPADDSAYFSLSHFNALTYQNLHAPSLVMHL
jgi:hypothetical protein